MNNNMNRGERKQRVTPHQCHFCQNNVNELDYKETNLLFRFLSSFAKIVPRKRSGVCASHQRMLANAVKRARIMALIPFVQK